MITRLTSEVFLKYANDSWSGLNTLVSSLGFDNLTKSINVDATAGAVVKTVPSNCGIGTRLLYRKIDSSTNGITINMPAGETVTRANLSSLTLTSCDDSWEIEKVTLTRWVLRDGMESGIKTDASGTQKFFRYFDGRQECSGRMKDSGAVGAHSFTIGTQGWSFNSQTLIITFIKPFIDIPECFGSTGTLSTSDAAVGGLASVEGATLTQLQISSWAQDANFRMKVYTAKGRWYA